MDYLIPILLAAFCGYFFRMLTEKQGYRMLTAEEVSLLVTAVNKEIVEAEWTAKTEKEVCGERFISAPDRVLVLNRILNLIQL